MQQAFFFNTYQQNRVMSFIDPWKDPQGSGYQLIQSLYAIGSGGLLGEGYGLSMQKLQYLPYRSTDFIFCCFLLKNLDSLDQFYFYHFCL